MMEGEVFGHSSGIGYVLWGVINLVLLMSDEIKVGDT